MTTFLLVVLVTTMVVVAGLVVAQQIKTIRTKRFKEKEERKSNLKLLALDRFVPNNIVNALRVYMPQLSDDGKTFYIFAPQCVNIEPNEIIAVPANFHLNLPHNVAFMLVSDLDLICEKDISIMGGQKLLFFDDCVGVPLINNSNETQRIETGDIIARGIFIKIE